MHLCAELSMIEFATRLMDLLLETRAWALARPHLETERQGLLLLEEIKSIQAAETEQGAYNLFGRLDDHFLFRRNFPCYDEQPNLLDCWQIAFDRAWFNSYRMSSPR
jgi:hypothetical protein